MRDPSDVKGRSGPVTGSNRPEVGTRLAVAKMSQEGQMCSEQGEQSSVSTDRQRSFLFAVRPLQVRLLAGSRLSLSGYSPVYRGLCFHFQICDPSFFVLDTVTSYFCLIWIMLVL